MLALSGDLRVRSANSAFYETFGLDGADTTGRLIYELGDQWNIPELRTLLEEMIPARQQIDDYEIMLEIPGMGKRCMQLNARRIGADVRRRLILWR